jgi:hypothetical protein
MKQRLEQCFTRARTRARRWEPRPALAVLACVLASFAAGACNKQSAAVRANSAVDVKGNSRSKSMASAGIEQGTYDAKCQGRDPRHEVSEYDTSGDNMPDVRKVFLRVGEGPLARLVLICRESDLNADGNKDVVRYYSDESRPLREESDRNFDGRMDEITVFQEGMILRQEFDNTNDGKVDTKIFFDRGKALRAERDLNGRSTPDRWQPDRWEYFEEGRMVRMGTDLDGDGKVDRWDRDMHLRRGPDLSAAPGTES